MIRHYSSFLSRKNFVHSEFFFVLRINIVISFDVTTKEQRRRENERKRFSRKQNKRERSFKLSSQQRRWKEISRSIIIAKKKTKKTQKNNEAVKKDFIETFKRILQKFITLIWALETETTSKDETFNWWFDIFEFIIESTTVYQYEKYQEIHDNFRKRNRKNVLSTIILADLNKKWK